MSDRELRDEIEVLYGELKQVRAQTDAPMSEELAKARTALQQEIETLTERKRDLKERLEELRQRKSDWESETTLARRKLSSLRDEIASRQPLGDPLGESRSNWETPTDQSGCAAGVWVVLCVAATAAAWWLT
jgi:chromosome segregation ATPase